MDSNLEVKPKNNFSIHKIVYLLLIGFFIFISYYYLVSSPISTNKSVTIHISKKQSLDSIANDLEIKKAVRHAFVLKIFVALLGASNKIPKGDYLFKDNLPAYRIAWMLSRGIHNVDPVKVTFKEGITNEEMATLLSVKISAFRRDLFLSDENSKQGYLFPDTYFFFPMTTSDEIIEEISNNFNKRISPLLPDIKKSGHDLGDIIKMAAIIQNEAHGESDAPMISGVLWNRIAKGMPLQVDVSRETYTRNGFPLVPISNPGMVAIKASLYPKNSPYLYYLHDKDGMIHFALTYEEHKSNISRYLK